MLRRTFLSFLASLPFLKEEEEPYVRGEIVLNLPPRGDVRPEVHEILGEWPEGKGDEEYDFWSPLLISEHSPLGD
jgi:hypothetical protein